MNRGLVIRFVALALVLGSFALGTPRHAGPDEPAHAVRAAGLVRGQVLGEASELGAAWRTFRVPTWVEQPSPGCFAMQPEVAAGCSTVQGGSKDADLASSAATYPPLAHLVPGLTTLLPGGARTLYLARLTGVVLWSFLLAAAFGRLARRGERAVFAAMLALTPAALSTLVVINPSGGAVAGSVALAVAWRDLADGDSGASGLWACGAAALLLTRPDGWFWFAAVACVVGAVAGRDALRRAWRACSRPARLAGTASLAASVAWSAAVRPALVPVPTEAEGTDLVAVVLARTAQHVDEAVGLFGWLDTSVPALATAGWWAALGAAAVLSWVRGGARSASVAAGAWLAFVAVGWAADLIGGSGSTGLVWQGRYALPLVITAIVWMALTTRPGQGVELPRAIDVVGVLGVGVIWVTSFAQALRRWSVGASGSPFPWRWQRGAAAIHPAVVLTFITIGTCWFISAVLTDAHARQRGTLPNGQ